MKKIFLSFLAAISATTCAFASNNFEYTYADTWLDTGYVAYVNPEKTNVYYRDYKSGYDSGVGASSVARSNNYPDTSTVFWPGFEGVSGGYTHSSVNGDLSDRTIHSYTATYQRGESPSQFFTGTNWQGNPTYGAYSGPFGSAKTGGYFANLVHVESGTSGLAQGAPVELNLGFNLDGTVSGNSAGYTRVYFGSQVFNVSGLDMENFSFPDADRAGRWNSSHNRGETLEMYTDGKWLGLDPALAFDSGDSWGQKVGSGEITTGQENNSLYAKVGDWFFVEGYFETVTELPNPGGLATDLQNIADFDNTMHFSLTPGEEFSGIYLASKSPASVTPEPISSALFLLGAGALTARRFKKR